MTKRDFQAEEYAQEAISKQMNTQCRKVSTVWIGEWFSYGAMGWIEAAAQHAMDYDEGCSMFVEVRDEHDRSRPTAQFLMQRRVLFECKNPRQGAD